MKTIKKRHRLLIVLCLALLCAGLADLMTNWQFLRLPLEQKGEIDVSPTALKAGDNMRAGKEPGTFELIDKGAVGFIELDSADDYQIVDLELTFKDDSTGFTITVDDGMMSPFGEKGHQVVPPHRNRIIMDVGASANTLRFHILEDGGIYNTTKGNPITITGIKVDNHYDFNGSRFFMVFSLVFLAGLLFIYRTKFLANLHWAFFVIALVFGLNCIIMAPPYTNYDEKEHFIKAYQIASFDLGLAENREIPWPENAEAFLYFDGRATAFDSLDEKDDYYETYGSNELSQEVYHKTTAESYMPTAYLPAALGIFLAKLLRAPFWLVFYAGRCTALLSFIAIITATIKFTPAYKRMIMMVALLPTVVFLASSYSADTMTTAGALALVGLFLKMKATPEQEEIPPWQVGLFTLICAVMCTSKMTYFPLFGLLYLVPNRCFKPLVLKSGREISPLMLKVITTLIVGVVLVINLLYSQSHGLIQWGLPGSGGKAQAMYLLTHPLRYLLTVVNYCLTDAGIILGGVTTALAYAGELPYFTALCFLIVFVLVGITEQAPELIRFKTWNKLFVLFIVIVSWGITISVLYVSYNPVGSTLIYGVQGRYLIPLLAPLLLLLKTNNISCTIPQSKMNTALLAYEFIILTMLVYKLFSLYSA